MAGHNAGAPIVVAAGGPGSRHLQCSVSIKLLDVISHGWRTCGKVKGDAASNKPTKLLFMICQHSAPTFYERNLTSRLDDGLRPRDHFRRGVDERLANFYEVFGMRRLTRPAVSRRSSA